MFFANGFAFCGGCCCGGQVFASSYVETHYVSYHMYKRTQDTNLNLCADVEDRLEEKKMPREVS